MALYRPIRTAFDYSILQHDVSSIALWIKTWSMSLQPNKCCAMVISRRKSPQESYPTLCIEGTPLLYVNSVKYLGICISSNLSWSSHIAKIHSKGKRLIGMLYRRFYKHANSNTLLKLYASLIRPHLECCSVVWDPYLNKDINLLEKTQKLGLRLCLKDWLSEYNDLLNRANLPSLETRRTRARL